jgi:hypothetical protein
VVLAFFPEPPVGRAAAIDVAIGVEPAVPLGSTTELAPDALCRRLPTMAVAPSRTGGADEPVDSASNPSAVVTAEAVVTADRFDTVGESA